MYVRDHACVKHVLTTRALFNECNERTRVNERQETLYALDIDHLFNKLLQMYRFLKHMYYDVRYKT